MFRLILCFIIFQLRNDVEGRESIQWHKSGEDYRDVNVTEGILRGFVVNGQDYEYLAFHGVPYAAPPVGNMRFKPPLPLGPWDGVRRADRRVRCPQDGQGEEDCLILNIFTPVKILNGPLPVLVYFHGGAYIKGSGPTGTGIRNLIKQNMIVVTVNYRLGAFGFLCLGIKEAPGNAGLKDQVAALKWLNRNIEQFGGDPNKVTIYGVSAGASSVEYHILSPMSKGLFQQAIIESGSATSVWSVDADPIATAQNLAIGLDAPTGQKLSRKDVYKLLDYLKKIPVHDISKVETEYHLNLTDGTFGFVPCVERHVPGREAFISKSPYYTLTRELYNKVPVMFIYSTVEGLFLRSSEIYNLNYAERMNADFSAFIPADLQFDSEEIRRQVIDNIYKFYFGDGKVGDDLKQYLDYFGDYLIMHSLLNSAESHSKDNSVYLMEFAYNGNLGNSDPFYESIDLPGHGDAAKYVLLRSGFSPETPGDILTVKRMIKLFTNFVRFGNPTPERSDLLPFIWPSVQPRNVSYLLLNNDFQIYEEPLWGRKVFWDSLYNKFRKPIKPVNPGF